MNQVVRTIQAQQSAQEWRERLGIQGVATREDTLRLIDAAVPGALIEHSPKLSSAMAYSQHDGDWNLLVLPAALDPEAEHRSLAWFVGQCLHGFCSVTARDLLAQEGRETFLRDWEASRLVAHAFGEAWRFPDSG